MTPIHLAAWYGLTQSVERLKDKYDSPIDNIETLNGRNPIHFAAMNGHLEIVKVLAKFADVPNAPDDNGTTPINYAAMDGNLEIVEFLTKLTDYPNAPNNYGNTPIHYAAWDGNLEIVEFLSKFTDDPNEPDNSGLTLEAMKIAKYRGHTQIVKYLEEYASTN